LELLRTRRLELLANACGVRRLLHLLIEQPLEGEPPLHSPAERKDGFALRVLEFGGKSTVEREGEQEEADDPGSVLPALVAGELVDTAEQEPRGGRQEDEAQPDLRKRSGQPGERHRCHDLDGFLTGENAEKLLIAPALTLAVIPLAYAVAWYSKREQQRLWKRLRTRNRYFDVAAGTLAEGGG
jgi:hypothetical protein